MVPGAHLFLDRVSRLDSGNYACIGANTFYDGDRGNGKNTTILDVQYKPEIHLQQSEIRVKEQASVTLACTIDSNPISEDHNWAFNGHVISSELIHTIDWANRSDAGVYNCTAVNTFYDGEQGTGFNITELIVEYIPVVNVQGPESAVVEGAQSSIACTVIDGVPDPYSITLYHINETVNEVQTIENRLVKNHTFDLGVVQRWNHGSYYCVANTSFADGTIESARSKNTELHVHYRPDITNPENEEVTVASGSPVSLHCSADAYPSADITWTKNGEELEPGADDTILHISAVNDSDEGLYVCTAENYVGVDEHEIQLNVNDSEHATQGTPSSNSSGGSPVAIALPCGIVFVVVSVVALGIVIRRRRRRTKTVEREKPDCGNKFEGDGNAYQEIEFEQVQEPNAYSSIEPNPVPERPNSYGDFEYEMPIEVLLEFPKENVHQKSIIGEGTFGKVARAEAWKLAGKEGPTIVALKTLKDNATGEDKKSLLDEFELLKHIGRHKHILSLVGCCTKTDEIYMLFEYMELGNLQDYLRKSRNYIATEYLEVGETSPVLTSGDLIIFARQVASGMEYLSSKKTIF
ncbi:fibroblast growth factor receptor 2-like [Ptychodera flava]|uniref:fibroblast growth factor receptor 2-like n=1 Tax=Ptychodera flava TaxID=63121 RepID=UPI00396A5ED8